MTGLGSFQEAGMPQGSPKASFPPCERVRVQKDKIDPNQKDSFGSIAISDRRFRTVFPKQNDSANKIRSRLLHSLGFDPAGTSPEARQASPVSLKTTRPRCVSFQEDLKADYGRPAEDPSDISSSSYGSVDSSKSDSSRRSVSFDNSVLVHPIPARTDYSDRIRPQLWTPVEEMQENAARNCLEFAAEGWDWRTVLDDESMVVVHGERIHPIHFAQQQSPQCSLRRQFVTVMSAQHAQQS
jgi:hypothetical protein